MKEGWVSKELSQICRIELGRTPARKSARMWDPEKRGNNIWLSIADLPKDGDPLVCESKEFISDDGALGIPIVPAGTLMMSFKLTIGRMAIAGKELRTNEAIACFRDLDATQCIRDYLLWYLKAFDWELLTKGDEKIKGKTLNKAKLKAVPIILPGLEEQQAIVDKLDRAFAGLETARANAEANLENAKELFQSSRDNLLAGHSSDDWEETSLGELVELRYGKALDRSERSPEGNVPVFGANGIKDWSHKSLDEGPSLIVGRKGSAGEITQIDGPFWPLDVTYFTSHDENRVLYGFLFYLMSSLNLPSLAKGVKPGINRNDVYSLDVRVPSLTEQASIVSKLDRLRIAAKDLEENFKRQLSDLDELKQSLLQKAFAGELT